MATEIITIVNIFTVSVIISRNWKNIGTCRATNGIVFVMLINWKIVGTCSAIGALVKKDKWAGNEPQQANYPARRYPDDTTTTTV